MHGGSSSCINCNQRIQKVLYRNQFYSKEQNKKAKWRHKSGIHALIHANKCRWLGFYGCCCCRNAVKMIKFHNENYMTIVYCIVCYSTYDATCTHKIAYHVTHGLRIQWNEMKWTVETEHQQQQQEYRFCCFKQKLFVSLYFNKRTHSMRFLTKIWHCWYSIFLQIISNAHQLGSLAKWDSW